MVNVATVIGATSVAEADKSRLSGKELQHSQINLTAVLITPLLRGNAHPWSPVDRGLAIFKTRVAMWSTVLKRWMIDEELVVR